MKRLVFATAASALLLAGCAASTDETATAPGTARSAPATGGPAPLAAYGLAGKSAVEVIDHLDRMGLQERPADLRASVRPGELVVSNGGAETGLDIPGDRFYLSVAPYVERTHDCFYHSLTTCKGELGGKEVQAKITDDATGRVLADGTRTTYANGFVGFWLPRDIKATLRITYAGRTAEKKITTDEKAPTCLTTLRLS
ncbi:CueP family metal-binding protein [Spirillospora albida]|uniref:CueP family metal-binding protein n=1 Tax=Spirillospora albida TaxID=58123 RepID=UPI0004C1655D|nr:CueP family metal-binding protein [Spirillospora albida]